MKFPQRYLSGALLAVFVVLAGAQEASPPASPPEEAPADPPAAPPVSQPRGEDDVFIPTEEVQADEELAFPVDI